MLRTKRGRCEAPELRPKDHSSALTSLCFHCAFGFSQPNGSRTCKTPWSVFQDGSEGPPTYSRQRCRPCQTWTHAIHACSFPRRLQSQEHRARTQGTNFTHAFGLTPTVRRVKHRRSAAANNTDSNAEILRHSNTTAALPST